MSQEIEHTITGYLGAEFQNKLMWQLLTEVEFSLKVLPLLSINYFDNHDFQKLFQVIVEYNKDNEDNVPNIPNLSIYTAIKQYTKSEIVYDKLKAIVDRLKTWHEGVLERRIKDDGKIIQDQIWFFIKQQEYRKISEIISGNIKNGNIKNKKTIFDIEELFTKVSRIGDNDNYGVGVFDNIDRVLSKTYRDVIPTGIKVIDEVTGGGLGKGEIGIVLAGTGVGKALPNSHRVLTPNGWVLNGDLKVGDYVIGSNGKSQKVLGVYPQGERDIYRIDFTDNTKSFCDVEHLWNVNTYKMRSKKLWKNNVSHYNPDLSFKTLKTSELMSDIKVKNGYNYRMPNLTPVDFNEVNVDIDPYIMGLLLGDGCITGHNQPHITTSDEFISEKLNKFDYIKVSKQKIRKDEYKQLYKLSLLKKLEYLKSINLYDCNSETKFIPNDYLYNSVKNRELLLQGLIDSDGYVNKNGLIIYTTVSKKLSENVRELVLSLGGCVRTNIKQKTYRYNGVKKNGKTSYNLSISFPHDIGVIPCTLPRKLERVSYRSHYKFNKFIKSIEYSHKEEATCIYVENPDHLYVIDDYILTHNTTILTKFANSAVLDGKNVLQVVLEDTEDQITRKHYSIWADVPLDEMDDKKDLVKERIIEKQKDIKGELVIIKLPQDETTILDVKKLIITYQKKFNIKFDMLVLDYIDCLEPHKHGQDQHQAELSIIKVFESMASELDIVCWSAIQANRSGNEQEWVEIFQMSGNIKRAQKTHFLMSVAKTSDMKLSGHANIKILKARFAQDGQSYENCVYDNNRMKIIINDNKPFINNKLPSADVNTLNNMANNLDNMVNNLVNSVESYNPLAVENIHNFESLKDALNY